MPTEANKLFVQTAALYERMLGDAKPLVETFEPNEDIPLQYANAANALVWSGRLIDTCVSVDIPRGGYKRVVDRLRELGSIEQLERGFRGSALSVFLLHYPPTQEVWDANVKSSREGLTDAPTLDRVAGEVRELQAWLKQLGGLDIVEAFRTLDNRISTLTNRVGELEEALSSNNTTST